MPRIVTRTCPPEAVAALTHAGLGAVPARVFAARGIRCPTQLDTDLRGLLPPDDLAHVDTLARRLADAIGAGRRLLVIADYDSDGATACAVAVRALREFGASVDYLVPNRFEYGYGLTPEIVRLAAERRPDVLITVDNGIASCAGVAEANGMGMEVLVTDHHLPGDTLPEAACIVNPNQPGCRFPSKNLAGVGVIFYAMLALRAELRRRGAFEVRPEPNLGKLLDLVSLGTVADVVKLDDNNRILVAQGLARIRAGRAHAGVAALFRVAGRDTSRAGAYDLGFMIGPRLNAAGRLDDMSLGIECLLTDDAARALAIAQELDRLNRERRQIEAEMHEDALTALDRVEVADSFSLSLFDEGWHQGIIGILASRLKEKFHRPVIAFAPGNGDDIKGSGRSIPGLHLRDALDLVAKREPDLLQKFGGHAAAAGLTIKRADFERFAAAFEAVAQSLLSPADLERLIETDGALDEADMGLPLARELGAQVWGQAFPEPTFHGRFRVLEQRVVGDVHRKLRLAGDRRTFDGILFFHPDPLPENIEAVYALNANEYNGSVTLQLTIKHWQE